MEFYNQLTIHLSTAGKGNRNRRKFMRKSRKGSKKTTDSGINFFYQPPIGVFYEASHKTTDYQTSGYLF